MLNGDIDFDLRNILLKNKQSSNHSKIDSTTERKTLVVEFLSLFIYYHIFSKLIYIQINNLLFNYRNETTKYK